MMMGPPPLDPTHSDLFARPILPSFLKPPPSLLPQVLTGCGTSLHAAMYASKLMRDFEAFRTCMAMVRGWMGRRRMTHICICVYRGK